MSGPAPRRSAVPAAAPDRVDELATDVERQAEATRQIGAFLEKYFAGRRVSFSKLETVGFRLGRLAGYLDGLSENLRRTARLLEVYHWSRNEAAARLKDFADEAESRIELALYGEAQEGPACCPGCGGELDEDGGCPTPVCEGGPLAGGGR